PARLGGGDASRATSCFFVFLSCEQASSDTKQRKRIAFMCSSRAFGVAHFFITAATAAQPSARTDPPEARDPPPANRPAAGRCASASAPRLFAAAARPAV